MNRNNMRELTTVACSKTATDLLGMVYLRDWMIVEYSITIVKFEVNNGRYDCTAGLF